MQNMVTHYVLVEFLLHGAHGEVRPGWPSAEEQEEAEPICKHVVREHQKKNLLDKPTKQTIFDPK